MESSLEKELREWREKRGRTMDAMAAARDRLFTAPPSPPAAHRKHGGRRVRVNGQEVLVVSKARRPLPS